MVNEYVPSGYCSKCGLWAWGGPSMKYDCLIHQNKDLLPFNDEKGDLKIFLTRKAFNKVAHVGKTKVTIKNRWDGIL